MNYLNRLLSHKILLLLSGVILVCGLVVYGYFSFNDVQHKAGFLNQYIKTQGLVQISSYGDAGNGPDTTSANYGSYYKSTVPTEVLKNSLASYLKQNGYWVKTVLVNPGCSYNSRDYCGARPPTNAGLPYWAIDSGNNKLLLIVTITNKTYDDTSSGERPNPTGYNVLHFDFSEPGTNPGWY